MQWRATLTTSDTSVAPLLSEVRVYRRKLRKLDCSGCLYDNCSSKGSIPTVMAKPNHI